MFIQVKRFMACTLFLFLLAVLSGCSGGNSIGSNTPFELEMPPEVELELVTIPEEPVAGELTTIVIKLLDDSKPRDGMRIELRENSRENRLFDAVEKIIDGKLAYEIEAVFEQSGENFITYHFNIGQHHIMSSIAVEVK